MKRITLFPIGYRASCPKCGNDTEFNAHSQQVCEDCCEVWIECRCGFDPTAERPGTRLESVMGGTSNENVRGAFMIWDELVNSQRQESNP